MKIVISRNFAGFQLSKEGVDFMAEDGCEQAKAELKQSAKEGRFFGFGMIGDSTEEYKRDNVHLVRAVEKLGEKAGVGFSKLTVVEVPDDGSYRIEIVNDKEKVVLL